MLSQCFALTLLLFFFLRFRAKEAVLSHVTLRVSLHYKGYQTLGQQLQIMSNGSFVMTDNVIPVGLNIKIYYPSVKSERPLYGEKGAFDIS